MNHGDHSGHTMPPRCSMNMLWNTQIENTCIVFRSWHIRTTTAFVFSFFIIVALGAFYEWLRMFQTTVDKRIALSMTAKGKGRGGLVSGELPENDGDAAEEDGLLTGRRVSKAECVTPIPPAARALRSFLYGATVFLSFFLMLVFMTYNAYLILAVVVGAALGHYVFNPAMDPEAVLSGGASGKGMACH
ncbi:copper transporter [Punctularia strigosozonata HHB-11173 SS5]|uniref:copper transporter n=1 Tax=Punctularia strigosozonata (strain HHB-11173) TaxID=741275 RepID=UPI0004417CD7|nr:copper transporter [Punctularia strigosozonata HHB-11173 SS5]EIN11437.1 copper transporter [Punctularia strigosozonata HHB-11173 SS5]